MESSIPKILVGSVVKRTLEDMKEDPNRGIRNLADMALPFSDGRFQEDFFTTAQTMLWELWEDNRLVDQIISGGPCCAFFDRDGNLCDENGPVKNGRRNLFQNDLKDIFMNVYPKKGCFAV